MSATVSMQPRLAHSLIARHTCEPTCIVLPSRPPCQPTLPQTQLTGWSWSRPAPPGGGS